MLMLVCVCLYISVSSNLKVTIKYNNLNKYFTFNSQSLGLYKKPSVLHQFMLQNYMVYTIRVFQLVIWGGK